MADPDDVPLDPLYPKVFVEGFEHIDPENYDFAGCWTRTNRDQPYNPDDVVAALLATAGNFGKMSTLLGRNRQRIRDYVFSDPIAKGVYENIRQTIMDEIEQVGLEGALGRDLPQVRYTLEHHPVGKERGYSIRVENTGAGGGPITTMNVELDANDPVEASRIYARIMQGKE